ncbi:hypothetical protein FB451DRAFT_1172347 [Mycena latifolia]|nr:hypothetical protein FB451DRAFT_1172347 [Mycena latifolia]
MDGVGINSGTIGTVRPSNLKTNSNAVTRCGKLREGSNTITLTPPPDSLNSLITVQGAKHGRPPPFWQPQVLYRTVRFACTVKDPRARGIDFGVRGMHRNRDVLKAIWASNSWRFANFLECKERTCAQIKRSVPGSPNKYEQAWQATQDARTELHQRPAWVYIQNSGRGGLAG